MIDPTRIDRRLLWTALGFVLVGLVVTWLFPTSTRARVGTFNIEMFPQSERQIDGAFETIDQLGVSLLAVQEITAPDQFQRAATHHLGESWRFVSPARTVELRPGVLYDSDHYSLEAMESHDETVVYDGARPVVEVELEHRTGSRLELFVVHLKAGSSGLNIRREQYDRLQDILNQHAQSDRRRTILLGDFNSTEPEDRHLLHRVAQRHDLQWTTRSTECTGYWIPNDECTSFKLDHMLADGITSRASADGPCRTQGCHPGRQCPIYHREISDHCPVVVSMLLE